MKDQKRPTPETDANTHWNSLPKLSQSGEIVHADLARKLERERDAARDALKLAVQWGISGRAYDARIAMEIREWVESGMEGEVDAPQDREHWVWRLANQDRRTESKDFRAGWDTQKRGGFRTPNPHTHNGRQRAKDWDDGYMAARAEKDEERKEG